MVEEFFFFHEHILTNRTRSAIHLGLLTPLDGNDLGQSPPKNSACGRMPWTPGQARMEGAQRHTGIVAQEHTGRRSTGHDARPPPAEGVDSCTAQAKCTGARRHHPRGRLKVRAAQARKGPPAKAMAWRRPHANRRHCEQPVQQLRATCQAHEPSRPKAVTCRALHRCCKSPAGLCADTLAHPHTCSATPTKTTQKRANASASPRAAHATPTTAAAASGRRPLGQPPAAIHRLQKNPQHQCEAPPWADVHPGAACVLGVDDRWRQATQRHVMPLIIAAPLRHRSTSSFVGRSK